MRNQKGQWRLSESPLSSGRKVAEPSKEDLAEKSLAAEDLVGHPAVGE
jgi:hypothetical protein